MHNVEGVLGWSKKRDEDRCEILEPIFNRDSPQFVADDDFETCIYGRQQNLEKNSFVIDAKIIR